MNASNRYQANITVYITVDVDSETAVLTKADIERAYENGDWDFHDHELGDVYDRLANVLIDPTTLPDGQES